MTPVVGSCACGAAARLWVGGAARAGGLWWVGAVPRASWGGGRALQRTSYAVETACGLGARGLACDWALRARGAAPGAGCAPRAQEP